jgi:alkylated DNA repair dioxygenase AlkB
MATLFPIEPVFPHGFYYYPNFISADEEQYLIRSVMNIELHNLDFQGYIAKRKVQSFGYDYSFDKRKLTKGQPIPEEFQSLIEKTAARVELKPENFAELLVTEYPVGSVINWHRDAPPFDLIAGISLSADCIFKLRPYDKMKRSRKSTLYIPVHRRSLYIMKSEARSDWEHSTAPVQNVRHSITLRTLKNFSSEN